MEATPHTSVAVCSAADSAYFGVLDGLVASLEAASLPKTWKICIFDLGLDSAQRANLEARGALIVETRWPTGLPRPKPYPDWFRGTANRPYLPQSLSGFETYLWLDADTWVQQPGCLSKLVQGAAHGAIVLAAERFGPPRSYRIQKPDGSIEKFAISEKSCRLNVERCYRTCFGDDKAHHAHGPIFNSGVFALRADSGVWPAWREYLSAGITRAGEDFRVLVEQAALTLGIIDGRIPIQEMPFVHNWNLSTLHPRLDKKRGLLVDPADNQTPLGIVHLIRLKTTDWITLESTTGEPAVVPLRYPQFIAKFGHRIDRASEREPG